MNYHETLKANREWIIKDLKKRGGKRNLKANMALLTRLEDQFTEALKHGNEKAAIRNVLQEMTLTIGGKDTYHETRMATDWVYRHNCRSTPTASQINSKIDRLLAEMK